MIYNTRYTPRNQAKPASSLASVLALSLHAARQTHTVADLRTFRRAVRFRKNDLDGTAGIGEFSRSKFNDLCAIRPSDPESAPLVAQTPHLSYPSSPLNQIKNLILGWRAKNPNVSYERETKRLHSRRANAAKAEKRRAGCWRRLDDLDRTSAYASTIIATGRAVCFTINIGDDVLQRAGKAEHGVFDHVRRRITRELTKALGDSPSLFCALDATSTGRLHIHGMLAVERDHAPVVVAALRRAGGTWASKRGAKHQVVLDAGHWQFNGDFFDDLDRRLTPDWGSYSAKHVKRLKAMTNHSIIYATKDVRDASKELHASQIKKKISHRSINTDLTENFVADTPLVNESQISFSAGVINIGRGSNHEDADRFAGILREPLDGHARHGCLSRQAPHLDRRAPALGAARLRAARRHDGRRCAHAPRSRGPIHPASQRADSRRARSGGTCRAPLLTAG